MKEHKLKMIAVLVLAILTGRPVGVYADNINAKLPTSGGSDAFQVQDSGGTPLFHAQSDGKVGIGTANPENKLHIAGPLPHITIEDTGATTDQTFIKFKYGPAPSSWDMGTGIIAPGGEFSPDFALYNNEFVSSRGADLYIQHSTGNVGIATTNPRAPLHVKAIGTAMYFEGTWPGAVTWGLASTFNNGMGTFDISNFGDGSAGVVNSGLAIREDGNVGIGIVDPNHPLTMASGAHVTAGGVWTNASSRENKENIQDLTIEDAMTALDDLRPTRFNYKVDKEEESLGFIAEEVPELVADNDRKGLSPMDIVAVLTKVVQQQQKEIEALKVQLSER